MVEGGEDASWRQIAAAIALYSFASATMLIVNKVVVTKIPVHSTVTSIQFAFAAVIVYAAKLTRTIDVDNFEFSKVKPYSYYVAAFVLGIYCNMRALGASNVETVIVFRTCTPLCVSLLDWMFLGRQLPSLRSVCALGLILAGAAGYVATDKQFAAMGFAAYTWVILYFFIICFEMTYGKYIISNIDLRNRVWGSVYYTNTLSILPMLFLGFVVFHEGENFSTLEMPSEYAWFLLLLSCVIGTLISYAGFNCRNLISATSYTVVGVMNKMATVLINCLIWDKHASALGIASLIVCIAGGTLFKQAPMRQETDAYSRVKASPPPKSSTARSSDV